ncbi:MAG: hypothetical protein DRQ40_08220 [Gammaproteobacteria bacterium]|nr:MAG: hypothetical protein DRQ40_08220 [Gammaproteobacteria bacterium]
MRVDLNQLEFIHQALRNILIELEAYTGFDFTITSLYRIGDRGVHGQLPLRGTDLRMRDKTTGQAIQKIINDRWAYDPARPDMECAILHGNGSNLHLHVQIHHNTERK